MKKIIERVMNTWIKLDKVFLVKAVIIAILGCIIFSNGVADFIYNHLVKYHEIVVCSAGNRENSIDLPKIIDNYYEDQSNIIMSNIIEEKKYAFYDFEQLKDSLLDYRDVSIVNADESEFDYGYFELIESDSYLKFELPVYPNTCLTLSTDNNAYAIMIVDNDTGNSRFVSYENTTSANSIKIYPYEMSDYLYIFIWYVIFYLALFFLLLVCIYSFVNLNKKIQNKVVFLHAYNPFIVSTIIFLLYILFVIGTYVANHEILQPSPDSDAYYYMNPQIWDDTGNFSMSALQDYLYTFRGYFSIVVAVLAKGFQEITGIAEIYFYFLYYGLVVSFTIGFSLPQLYEYFTGKKASNQMCLIMFAIFFVFWNQIFYYALVDIPAAMFALCGISYTLWSNKNKSCTSSLIGGICWGIALSYRMAYSYIFIALILWLTFSETVFILKKKKKVRDVFKVFMVLIVGIVIISIPQFYINYTNDHIGFFPYSGGWVYDINAGEYTSLSWYSFTRGFHKYEFIGMINADEQLANIDQYYYMNKMYSAGDLFYIVFTNPIAFFVGYFKRMFWAMSATIEFVYDGLSIPEWCKIIAQLLNYYILIEFILRFVDSVKQKVLNIKDCILWIVLTISSIFVQNLSHIERRYFLFYYLLIYFIIAFNFKMNDKNEKKDLKRFVLTICVVLCCFIARQTIYYNFI